MHNAEDICEIMGPYSLEVTANNLTEILTNLLSHPHEAQEKGEALKNFMSIQKNSLKDLVQLCQPYLSDSHENPRILV